jgi:BASS family bile acid:Na+ symporter
MKQSLLLLGAISIGLLFPIFSGLSFLLPYLLGTMLFFAFSKSNISLQSFKNPKVYLLFFVNICIGWASYFLCLPFGKDIAFAAFLVGMIPTALAAPAVILVLKGKVDFVIASVIVSNLGIGILLPFFSSFLSPVEISASEMLIKTITLLFVPFLLARFIRAKTQSLHQKVLDFSSLVFFIWAALIVISMAKMSILLRENWEQYADTLLPIAGITAIICIINFTLGHFLGGKNYSKEFSQALGQKNPILMIWIALTFFTPFFALGPIFYMLFHNLVNSWKMAEQNKKIPEKNK